MHPRRPRDKRTAARGMGTWKRTLLLHSGLVNPFAEHRCELSSCQPRIIPSGVSSTFQLCVVDTLQICLLPPAEGRPYGTALRRQMRPTYMSCGPQRCSTRRLNRVPRGPPRLPGRGGPTARCGFRGLLEIPGLQLERSCGATTHCRIRLSGDQNFFFFV